MSPDRRHGRISTSLSQRSSPDTSSLFSIWPRQLMTWFITPSASKSSYTQVPQDPDQTQLESGSEMEASQLVKARLRTYWLATVLCCGGALFGYDSGVIGGVLTFGSFKESFQFTATQKTHISAIAVGIQQAGAFAGCFIIWPVTNRYGRRIAMMLCALVFCVGVILETVDSHSLAAFYVGRVICGLGVGGSATIIPIYMSEMSPKEIRGRLGSCYQFTYTIGILVSYWIDYGVEFMPSGARQWQIPIALQLVPGALMGIGMFTLDESVRWLLAHGKTEEAWRSLVWIRAGDGPAVSEEFEDMRRGLEDERHATAGFRLRELLEGPNLHRLLIGGGLFLAQQSTGSTALAYFGPQFFSLLVGPGDKNLLLTGIFGAIKVVSCGFFVIFMSDRFGRRPTLTIGAAFMAACMVATAAVIRRYPPTDGVVTNAGIATVALIYLDIIAYNLSWGPLPWPCASEIFPTRIREPGVAFGVGSQWLFNFVWSFSTPYIMAGIGWGTFLLFGLLDVLIVGFTYSCLKETAGKTLEEINSMYDGVDADAEHGWKGDAFGQTQGPDREPGQSHSDGAESVRSDTKSSRHKMHAAHLEQLTSISGRA